MSMVVRETTLVVMVIFISGNKNKEFTPLVLDRFKQIKGTFLEDFSV